MIIYICTTTIIITIIILCYTLFKIRKYDNSENYMLSITYINDIIDNYFIQHNINIKITVNDISCMYELNKMFNYFNNFHILDNKLLILF